MNTVDEMLDALLGDLDTMTADIVSRAEDACARMPRLERELEIARYRQDCANVRFNAIDKIKRVIEALPMIERNCRLYREELRGIDRPEVVESEIDAYRAALVRELAGEGRTLQ
jgi:hypothetical protein